MIAGRICSSVAVLALLCAAVASASCPAQCACTGRSVSCRGAGLLAIPTVGNGPTDIPPNTHHLDLSDNRISVVPGRVFAKLGQLKFLNLQSNALSQLDADTFAGLASVTRLYVGNNNIHVIEEGTFDHLHSLVDLSMVGNPSQCDADFDCDCAAGLLAGEGFCVLSEDCGRPRAAGDADQQLECPDQCRCSRDGKKVTVDCFDRGLTAVPTHIPRDVTDLDLGSNSIAALWGQLAQFPLLQQLRLEDNSLSALRATDFQGLDRLQFLALDENEIRFVEPGVFESLPSLERVMMADNPSSCRFSRGLLECSCAPGLAGETHCIGHAAGHAPTMPPQRHRHVDGFQAYRADSAGASSASSSSSSSSSSISWSTMAVVLVVLLAGAGAVLMRRKSNHHASHDMPLYYGSSDRAAYW